ncbi:MAG: right-handed parallel beta-helix repeat-containing protein, partial [Methanobacterium sp.]
IGVIGDNARVYENILNGNGNNKTISYLYGGGFDNKGAGVVVTGNNATVSENTAMANSNGISLIGDNGTLTGNTADSNVGNGIKVTGKKPIITSDNIIHDNGGHGLYVTADNINLSGFDIYNNGLDGIYAPGQNVTISNNKITNNGGNGITVTGDNEIVTGNTVTNKGNIGISVIGAWAFVSNNLVSNSIEDGISVLGDNAVVTWNTVTNSKMDGILVNGNYASVSNNTVSENNGSGIVVNGYAATIMSNYATSQKQGNGISVTGNNSFISQNTAEYNGNNGIFIDGNLATVYKNTVNNNGSPVHSEPCVPNFDISSISEEMNHIREEMDLYIAESQNSTFMAGLTCTMIEFFMNIVGELASEHTMADYYSELNNLCDGNVESKLLSLGEQGNGIEVLGDFASISNNYAFNNGGYGIFINGNHTTVDNNSQVTGNGGGITVIGNYDHLTSNIANENDWVGIYVRSDRGSDGLSLSSVEDCITNYNGIGIVVSGVVYVAYCHANKNKLDGILAIGDYSAIDINPFYFCNGLYSNEVSKNGANGIYSYGNNAMLLNYGEGNSLVGIMVYGNPLILAAPNSAEGVIGTSMPPTAQLLQLAGYLSGVYGIVEFVLDRVPEYLSSLQAGI